jgi:hypothetical protein
MHHRQPRVGDDRKMTRNIAIVDAIEKTTQRRVLIKHLLPKFRDRGAAPEHLSREFHLDEEDLGKLLG